VCKLGVVPPTTPIVLKFHEPIRIRIRIRERDQRFQGLYAVLVGKVRLEKLRPPCEPVDGGTVLVVFGCRGARSLLVVQVFSKNSDNCVKRLLRGE
jgi:hypothetical protein